jgi:hypothetical protein
MTWADARDAYLQIDVTQRLVDQANVAMRLAKARYDAGLGSIVELNQAELNQTSALITAATARFDYLRSMTAFQFAWVICIEPLGGQRGKVVQQELGWLRCWPRQLVHWMHNQNQALRLKRSLSLRPAVLFAWICATM